MFLLKDLHYDTRTPLIGKQRLTRVVEVRVGVVPGAHLLDRKIEDLRWKTVGARAFSRRHVRARDRPRVRLLRLPPAPESDRQLPGDAAARDRASQARATRPYPDCDPSSQRSPWTSSRLRAAQRRVPGSASEQAPARRACCRARSSRAAGREDVIRNARVLSPPAPRSRSFRWRCAPHRGRRRAPSCAAQAPPVRPRAAPRRAPELPDRDGRTPARRARRPRSPTSRREPPAAGTEAAPPGSPDVPRERLRRLRGAAPDRAGAVGRAVPRETAWGPKRPSTLPRRAEQRRPTQSGHGRARRSQAPSRRAGSSLQPSLRA